MPTLNELLQAISQKDAGKLQAMLAERPRKFNINHCWIDISSSRFPKLEQESAVVINARNLVKAIEENNLVKTVALFNSKPSSSDDDWVDVVEEDKTSQDFSANVSEKDLFSKPFKIVGAVSSAERTILLQWLKRESYEEKTFTFIAIAKSYFPAALAELWKDEWFQPEPGQIYGFLSSLCDAPEDVIKPIMATFQGNTELLSEQTEPGGKGIIYSALGSISRRNNGVPECYSNYNPVLLKSMLDLGIGLTHSGQQHPLDFLLGNLTQLMTQAVDDDAPTANSGLSQTQQAINRFKMCAAYAAFSQLKKYVLEKTYLDMESASVAKMSFEDAAHWINDQPVPIRHELWKKLCSELANLCTANSVKFINKHNIAVEQDHACKSIHKEMWLALNAEELNFVKIELPHTTAGRALNPLKEVKQTPRKGAAHSFRTALFPTMPLNVPQGALIDPAYAQFFRPVQSPKPTYSDRTGDTPKNRIT